MVYTGLHQTPEMIAAAAVQEAVDAVGLSIMSGAHMTLFPAVIDALRGRGAGDVLVFGGGIVPDEDIERLVQPEQRARDERQQHDQRDERFFHALSIAASTARNPCASPPTGRPGRFTSFHAYTSKCAHGMSRGTK